MDNCIANDHFGKFPDFPDETTPATNPTDQATQNNGIEMPTNEGNKEPNLNIESNDNQAPIEQWKDQPDCRAIKDKGMVFSNTWVYSKKDTLDIHTGWWSLVNYWREGSCETLYNVLMNINQMAVGLTAGRSDGSALLANRCINVIPRHPPFLQRRGIACM